MNTEIIFAPDAHDYSLPPETKTPSGLILTSFSALYGELRAWVKFRGEPAQTLYCTPEAFRECLRQLRKMEKEGADTRDLVIAACDHLYGLPQYYPVPMINELVFVGVTHQPKERAKPAPGGIWMGDWEGPKAGVWIE